MIWFYIAWAIFGLAFVGPMVAGGLGGTELDTGADAELELDADVDAELGAEVDLDAADAPGLDLDGGGGLAADVLGGLLSFRSVVFFSAFFGVAGAIFTALDYATILTALTAVLVGGVAAVSNSMLFTLLRRSQADSTVTTRDLTGRPAVVTIPVGAEQRGRIRIDLAGQPQFLVARHYDRRSPETFGIGASVVVVEITDGVAHVAALELDGGADPALPAGD